MNVLKPGLASDRTPYSRRPGNYGKATVSASAKSAPHNGFTIAGNHLLARRRNPRGQRCLADDDRSSFLPRQGSSAIRNGYGFVKSDTSRDVAEVPSPLPRMSTSLWLCFEPSEALNHQVASRMRTGPPPSFGPTAASCVILDRHLGIASSQRDWARQCQGNHTTVQRLVFVAARAAATMKTTTGTTN